MAVARLPSDLIDFVTAHSPATLNAALYEAVTLIPVQPLEKESPCMVRITFRGKP